MVAKCFCSNSFSPWATTCNQIFNEMIAYRNLNTLHQNLQDNVQGLGKLFAGACATPRRLYDPRASVSFDLCSLCFQWIHILSKVCSHNSWLQNVVESVEWNVLEKCCYIQYLYRSREGLSGNLLAQTHANWATHKHSQHWGEFLSFLPEDSSTVSSTICFTQTLN